MDHLRGDLPARGDLVMTIDREERYRRIALMISDWLELGPSGIEYLEQLAANHWRQHYEKTVAATLRKWELVTNDNRPTEE